MKRLLISILFMIISIQGVAASCTNKIPASSPDDRFTIKNDGTAIDNTTNLMWMRCSIGTIWNGNTCTFDGIYTFLTWSEALTYASSSTYGDYSDWRLPNIQELRSIVEVSCYPTINSNVFDINQNFNYWSSTTSERNHHRAWVVMFANGISIDNNEKENSNHVRLVRNN